MKVCVQPGCHLRHLEKEFIEIVEATGAEIMEAPIGCCGKAVPGISGMIMSEQEHDIHAVLLRIFAAGVKGGLLLLRIGKGGVVRLLPHRHKEPIQLQLSSGGQYHAAQQAVRLHQLCYRFAQHHLHIGTGLQAVGQGSFAPELGAAVDEIYLLSNS